MDIENLSYTEAKKLIDNPKTSQDVLKQLAEKADPFIAAYLLQRKDLSSDAIHELTKIIRFSSPSQIVLSIVTHPNTSEEDLNYIIGKDLVQHIDNFTNYFLERKDIFTSKINVLVKISKYRTAALRLAAHPRTPEFLLIDIFKKFKGINGSEYIYKELAENPSLPKELIPKLITLASSEDSIAYNLAKNPSVPHEDILELLSLLDSPYKRSKVVFHIRDLSFLYSLKDDPNPDIRLALVMSGRANKEILFELLNDRDSAVAGQALQKIEDNYKKYVDDADEEEKKLLYTILKNKKKKDFSDRNFNIGDREKNISPKTNTDLELLKRLKSYLNR